MSPSAPVGAAGHVVAPVVVTAEPGWFHRYFLDPASRFLRWAEGDNDRYYRAFSYTPPSEADLANARVDQQAASDRSLQADPLYQEWIGSKADPAGYPLEAGKGLAKGAVGSGYDLANLLLAGGSLMGMRGPLSAVAATLNGLSGENIFDTRASALGPTVQISRPDWLDPTSDVQRHWSYAGRYLTDLATSVAGKPVELGLEARPPAVSLIDWPSIKTIGGKTPRNGKYAGGVIPLDKLRPGLGELYPNSVRINEHGYPELKEYAKKEYYSRSLSGNKNDATMADIVTGRGDQFPDHVWHHVEDGETMYLVPRDLHAAVGHTGGVAAIKYGDRIYAPVTTTIPIVRQPAVTAWPNGSLGPLPYVSDGYSMFTELPGGQSSVQR